MTEKQRLLDINLYYHLYNCGVEKRSIFSNKDDYARFLNLIYFYRYKQKIPYTQFDTLSQKAKDLYLNLNPRTAERELLKIIAYSLMPNHFHFLVKATKKEGIPTFMAKISNSYTKYFNIKYDRLGSLFQGRYKSKEMPSDEAILQVSRYIHLNPVESRKTNPHGNLKPDNYIYSSYRLWISPKIFNLEGSILDKKEINEWVNLIGSPYKYRDFVESRMNNQPGLGISRLILE